MNDRWKMIMDCTVSQIALVLLFGGLVTAKIAELNNFGNLEMAASFYISYLYMLGGVKGVIIWIPVAILVETHIIKELKDKTNKM